MTDIGKVAIRKDRRIYNNGYTWKGMTKISPAEALARYENKEEVFILYDNGAEGVIEDIELIEVGGAYGIEN